MYAARGELPSAISWANRSCRLFASAGMVNSIFEPEYERFPSIPQFGALCNFYKPAKLFSPQFTRGLAWFDVTEYPWMSLDVFGCFANPLAPSRMPLWGVPQSRWQRVRKDSAARHSA